MESFEFKEPLVLDHAQFDHFAEALESNVAHVKGTVAFADGSQLFHYVHGHWTLKPLAAKASTALTFSGPELLQHQADIVKRLRAAVLRTHPI